MADLCVAGSVVAQDFYSEAFLSGETSFSVRRQKDLMAKMGEPWISGLDMSKDPQAAVESFLNGCGLEMTEYMQFGQKLNIEPFYCIVEARKL